jgi:NADH-quinone oxidoreductase subunit G
MKITIDQREIDAEEGETVIKAARRAGIEIPHFCWHVKLSIAGNCRMCLVKVNNMPKLMPACNVAVAPKMTIETQGEDVTRARAQVMQFILLNHPVDCGICDKAGECTLQDNQVRYGTPETRSSEVKLHKRKLVPLSPRISLDNERCILCSRCVRFTREISGSNALGIVERGNHSYVDRVGSQPFDDPYSDNVIGICPTGALLSSDFLYQSRVWFLEPVRSVCTGCARGCSVQAWRRKKLRESQQPGAQPARQAYRISACENDEINGPWLCNKGFDMHKWMARERVLQPQLAGRSVGVDEAMGQARRLVAAARKPALLVSAHASNEELDALQALPLARWALYARQDLQPAADEVVEDGLLIRADKNPNSLGVHQRFGAHAYDTAAGHDLVLVWGEMADFAPLGDVHVVHLGTFGPPNAKADVVLPISTTFERSGSFSNFEGKTNVFTQVFDKPPLVQHAADVLGDLLS